jgi:hypothetical protein
MLNLSREAKVVSGVSILTVPLVMFGGATILGVVTNGTAGLSPGNLVLDAQQLALWRAGHAHAGVWLILSLVLQMLLDAATLTVNLRRTARILAPLAAVFISAGFFGTASNPALQVVIYLGAACLLVSGVLTAIGLIRDPHAVPVVRREPVPGRGA